ncbi:GNAT family N-acetyltransferase [Paraburkholderia phenazinium]|uniref:Acetyltransferase (GNAT) family protein n=1 Tax=Paraburkholderia phenazinium TaxID=60549 RepID=A0A1N6JJI4_9BURK|nr:Acetyltransferase (GNAT) family protein [Paraburkholderia phenazinium]
MNIEPFSCGCVPDGGWVAGWPLCQHPARELRDELRFLTRNTRAREIRAQGIERGKRLAESIVQIAKESGYSKIRLDTLPTMYAAQKVYALLGFVPIPAYVFNPVEGTQFLELDLHTVQELR